MGPSSISDTAILVAQPDVLSTAFAGETVLLNLSNGVYYGLADIAAQVWPLLQNPVTLAGLRHAILKQYDVDPARCERDLQTFLNDLLANGLIQITPGALA